MSSVVAAACVCACMEILVLFCDSKVLFVVSYSAMGVKAVNAEKDLFTLIIVQLNLLNEHQNAVKLCIITERLWSFMMAQK